MNLRMLLSLGIIYTRAYLECLSLPVIKMQTIQIPPTAQLLAAMLWLAGINCGCGPKIITMDFTLTSKGPVNIDQQLLKKMNLVYQCYPQNTYDICIPSISKGNRILAVSDSLDISGIVMDMEKRGFQAGSSEHPKVNITPIESPSTEAETALFELSPKVNVYDIGSYFPKSIESLFNRHMPFSGPNCYNTALIASGLIPADELRYVSLQEFESYLKLYFDSVTDPKPGDLLVYDALETRGHAAIYLFGNLIFHKKGYSNAFGYRITSVETAFDQEPYESQPTTQFPFIPQALPTITSKQKSFYRLKPNGQQASSIAKLRKAPLQPREMQLFKLYEFLNQEILTHSKSGSIGSKMGTLTRSLINQVLAKNPEFKLHDNIYLRESYLRLVSNVEQVFLSINEELYSSPFAEPHLIDKDFCFHDNAYTKQLLNHLRHALVGVEWSPLELEKFLESRFLILDKKTCKIDINTIFSEIY